MNPRHERFVGYYVELGDARAAAVASGYVGENVGITGSKLLKRPEVRDAIERLQRRALERAEITAAHIAREAWSIASNAEYAPAARVSALQLLAKRHIEFSEKFEIKGDMVLQNQALQAISIMSPEDVLLLAERARSAEDMTFTEDDE